MKYSARICMVIGVLLGMSSCIMDDLSGCDVPSPLALRFIFTHHDDTEETTDLFSEYVDHLHLFIFDGDNRWVDRMEIPQRSLKNGNTLYLDLDKREYKAVVWGNLSGTGYEVGGAPEKPREEYRVEVKESHNEINDLFHGAVTLPADASEAVYEISLVRNTHIVRVMLLGLPEGTSDPLNNTGYSVEIEGSNNSYNFENNTVGDTTIKYIPEYTGFTYQEEYVMQAGFKVQRLLTDSDLRLRILLDGLPVMEELLVKRILAAYDGIVTDHDLDGHYIYELCYEVAPMGFVFVSNNIRDWNGTSMPGEVVTGKNGEN